MSFSKEKRDIGMFLISAYAPIGNAPDDEWDSYFEQLTRCISRMSRNDILLMAQTPILVWDFR